jgi:hypothetical protein
MPADPSSIPKTRARAAGDPASRGLAGLLRWPEACDAWGSVGAMLLCLVAVAAAVEFYAYYAAIVLLATFNVLEAGQITLALRILTLSAVVSAVPPLYLPRAKSAGLGAALGLMAGIVAGAATSLFDNASEQAFVAIMTTTGSIAVVCMISALAAWIVGALLSRLARYFVSDAHAFPRYIAAAVVLAFCALGISLSLLPLVESWYKADAGYRLVPSVWKGSVTFERAYPFTLVIERVEPGGRFTGFMDWEGDFRLAIEGTAAGNHLIFEDTKILRGGNVPIGDRKNVWISGTEMTGTDKDGRAKLVAQLDPTKHPEIAAAVTPVAAPPAPASVPDVPPDNVAALVTMSAVLPLERPRAPRAVVDRRGWIDVWELRRDVAQVEDMPRPDDRCSFRESPEKTTPEEFDAATQACEKESKRAAAALARARRGLNAAWLPALKEAMAKGDPVAEVILRTCNTSQMLDRSGIETDCSEDPRQKELARQRLVSIGFVPALAAFTREELRSLARAPAAALYERMIDAMEKGDVGAASVGGGNQCPQQGPNPYADQRFMSCNHLYRMTRAIGHQARWFFTPAPVETWMDEKGVQLETLYIVNAEAFKKELGRRLRVLDASVAAYLRKEPRWAVFLIERDGETVRFAVPPKAIAGS